MTQSTMPTRTLLIELGTEELPPKALKGLSASFAANISDELNKAKLAYSSITPFAAPRRLAVMVHDCVEAQADSQVEKRGPAVSAAFDADGQATRAAQGWAKGNGISVEQATRLVTDKGEWLMHVAQVRGLPLATLLQGILEAATKRLPIPKPMRWGDSDAEFIRPVHTLTVLHGEDILPLTLFGLKADRQLSGHRFHGDHRFTLDKADHYMEALQAQFVLADYAHRTNVIEQQLLFKAQELGLQADYDQALLEEISSLVEWPVVLSAQFDPAFLLAPKEALIYTMKDDQKYVPLLDAQGQLSSTFLFVSNIDSKDPKQVVEGNQKVIRPRLADAMFFFETDKKTSLASKADKLSTVLFQKELGTLADKRDRLVEIVRSLSANNAAQSDLAVRAAELAKADLLSNMVMEFPSVQGIMGNHYAVHDGEDAQVALAIEEQYLPRFAGDRLPSSPIGSLLALADKLDTLVGIFGIGKLPKGDKDPFALRRSAIGLLRIMVENKLAFPIRETIEAVVNIYGAKITNSNTADQVVEFLFDRFKPLYQDAGISGDVVIAVMALTPCNAVDIDARVRAVNTFKQLDSAASLVAANKRVANILSKNDIATDALADIDPALFDTNAESALFSAYELAKTSVEQNIKTLAYQDILSSLTVLRGPLDAFFDDVMIMAEDPKVKANRIALVGSVRRLFLSVADVSLLSV